MEGKIVNDSTLFRVPIALHAKPYIIWLFPASWILSSTFPSPANLLWVLLTSQASPHLPFHWFFSALAILVPQAVLKKPPTPIQVRQALPPLAFRALVLKCGPGTSNINIT